MSKPSPISLVNPPAVANASSPIAVITSKGPHELECLIQRGLQSHPSLKFSRLKVHHCPQGVCLEGLLESNDDDIDLCELVKEIAGIEAINHVVTRSGTQK